MSVGDFRDLDEFFDDTLSLPIGGRTYVIPAPDAELGLYCQRLLAAGFAVVGGKQPAGDQPPVLDDDGERDLYQRCLGTAYDEMLADGISWPKVRRAGVTAFLWTAQGEELAVAYWSGSPPEALAPTPASPSTAAATSTRKRGSTSGTKSPTRSGETKPAPRRRSRGATS
jgi:hypothetical protein